MRKIILLFILFIAAKVTSQDLEPMDIAKFYLSAYGFPDKEKYYCCEFNNNKSDSTFGMYFPESITREYELIRQIDSSAVISVTVNDPVDTFDTYLYFKNQNGWKLGARRGLALSGIAFGLIKEYEKYTPEERKNFQDTSEFFKEWDLMYKIAKLQISSDKEIIKHFVDQKAKYEKLLDHVKKYDDIDMKEFTELQKTDTIFKNMKDDALIMQIYRFAYSPIGKIDLKNCYFLMINGVLDNTVGYLYSPEKNNLPQIDKSGFIIIKEIGEGWYLYKTT